VTRDERRRDLGIVLTLSRYLMIARKPPAGGVR
jgi:hypothetical protein